jgi:hypothetical protein
MNPEEQSDKMADVWPIENIWSFIKEKLKHEEIQDISILKKKIVEIWRTITPKMCSDFINSIPRRLQCLINKKGFKSPKKNIIILKNEKFR